jgi:energy-coupling factor transporter transmembrane protein EcfT
VLPEKHRPKLPLPCDARLLAAVSLGAIVLALAGRDPRTGLTIAGVSIFACIALGARARDLTRGLLPVLMLAAVAVVVRVGSGSGPPLFTWSLFGTTWSLRRSGVEAAALGFAKMLGAGAALRFLTLAADARQLLSALSWLGAPRPLLEITVLSLRCAESLVQCGANARASLLLRGGFRARTVGKSVGLLAGTILLRGVQRSERLGVALVMRGYTGALPLPILSTGSRAGNAAVAAAGVVAIGLTAAAFEVRP